MNRRRMMTCPPVSDILYPLIAGTAWRAFRLTTSKTGHVSMYNETRQSGGKYANLKDVSSYYINNGIEQLNCPLWFELKAGETCVFEISNKPSYVQLNLYVANSTSIYKSIPAQSNILSFTVENDVEIGCVGLHTTAAIAAKTTAEFDISLTVDGRRYF